MLQSMLGLFNKKTELLPSICNLSITWYYQEEILLEVKKMALELISLLPENPSLTYLGAEIDLKKLFKLIDKDIFDDFAPSIIFGFKDLSLNVYGRVYFENPNRLIKTLTLNIEYDDAIFRPIEYIRKLEQYEFISKIYKNEKFDYKQNNHDILFFNEKELKNKLIYPGYQKGAEKINKSKNPGYAICVEKYGLIGIGCYNEYSKPLVDAFGENVIINALNKFKLPYKWENNYLKFQLYEDHRKAEFSENIKLLVNFKKEINFDQFLEEQAKDLESDEIFNNKTENIMPNNKMLEDLKASSEWIVERFRDMEIELDYSLDSLKHIDLFLNNEFTNGKPNVGSVVEGNVGGIVFALGSYLGETIIKNSKDGIWIPNPEDVDDEINISIEINKQFVAWPMQKILKNIRNHEEISIYEFSKHFLNLN